MAGCGRGGLVVKSKTHNSCENAPVLGKGRMDRAEALVEPGDVELRGHGGGGGWRYYVAAPVDRLRHASAEK